MVDRSVTLAEKAPLFRPRPARRRIDKTRKLSPEPSDGSSRARISSRFFRKPTDASAAK